MKRMNIAVIGLGHVGGEICAQLIAEGIPQQLFIHDIDNSMLEGQMQDLLDMRHLLSSPTKVKYFFPSASREVDLFIIAVGKPRRSSSDAHDIEANAKALKSVFQDIYLPNSFSTYWIVTNPYKEMAEIMKSLYPGADIVGIGDLLDAARKERTLGNPEKTAEYILDNKGYTNFGVSAEVISRLRRC